MQAPTNDSAHPLVHAVNDGVLGLAEADHEFKRGLAHLLHLFAQLVIVDRAPGLKLVERRIFAPLGKDLATVGVGPELADRMINTRSQDVR